MHLVVHLAPPRPSCIPAQHARISSTLYYCRQLPRQIVCILHVDFDNQCVGVFCYCACTTTHKSLCTWMPVFMPNPPEGGKRCAASPTKNTRFPCENRAATWAVMVHARTDCTSTCNWEAGTPAAAASSAAQRDGGKSSTDCRGGKKGTWATNSPCCVACVCDEESAASTHLRVLYACLRSTRDCMHAPCTHLQVVCDDGGDDIGIKHKVQHAWHTWRLLHASRHILTEKVHIDEVLQRVWSLHWDVQQVAGRWDGGNNGQ